MARRLLRRPTSNFMIRAGLFLVPFIAAHAALPAHAYEVKRTSKGSPVHWRESRPHFVMVPTGDDSRDALTFRALSAAAAAWSEASGVPVTVERTMRDLPIGFEQRGQNHNVVRWELDEWEAESDMLALTYLRYDSNTGEIVDADVLINGADYEWIDRMEAPEDEGYDLHSAMAHELGHALGLAHSDVREATMFATTRNDETHKRDLDVDDLDAIGTLYAGLEFSEPAADSGGCAAAPGSRDGMLGLLVAFGLAGLLRKKKLAVLAGLLAGGTFAVAAEAMPARGGLRTILARADAVLEGRVISQTVEQRANGTIITVSELTVERCLAGGCPDRAVVEQPGGELGDVGLAVEGSTPLALGERVTLALRIAGARWRPVRLDHGRLMDLDRARPDEVRALRSLIESEWPRRLEARVRRGNRSL